MARRALILLPHAAKVPDEHDFDIVICADSGVQVAHSAGMNVDLLIGDLDSISEEDLEKVKRDEVEIKRHPTDKDMTDGELALKAACEMGFDDILIMGGRKGRMDHVISSLLMSLFMGKGRRIEVRMDNDRFIPLMKGDNIQLGTRYGTVSIIPICPVNRVSTSGLKWELEDDEIPLGSTRGIHNEIKKLPFSVECSEGAVLLFLSMDG
ncbi:MAG: thiamine diphosphokinase [Thermoplasmatota archaeon]